MLSAGVRKGVREIKKGGEGELCGAVFSTPPLKGAARRGEKHSQSEGEKRTTSKDVRKEVCINNEKGGKMEL